MIDEWKEITVDMIRFCEICGKTIRIGSKAYWHSGNTRHVDCLSGSLGSSTVKSGKDIGSFNNPPTLPQLDYLKSLGYSGDTPNSSKEASDLIRELVTKKESGKL